MDLKYVKQNSCPNDEILQAFLQKILNDQDHTNVRDHLQYCEACVESLRQLPTDDSGQLISDFQEEITLTPELEQAIKRFRERETFNLSHSPKSRDQIEQEEGLKFGQIWRPLLSDVHLPRADSDKSVTASNHASTPRLIVITGTTNGQGELFGGHRIVHVAPISPEIEYAAEGDWMIDEANSPFGYALMIELWNEQPMLQEHLDSCLGSICAANHSKKSVLQERLREVRLSSVQPVSRQAAVMNGSYRDPVVRFRVNEYEETAYLRVPVESLRDSIKSTAVSDEMGDRVTNTFSKAIGQIRDAMKETVFATLRMPDVAFAGSAPDEWQKIGANSDQSIIAMSKMDAVGNYILRLEARDPQKWAGNLVQFNWKSFDAEEDASLESEIHSASQPLFAVFLRDDVQFLSDVALLKLGHRRFAVELPDRPYPVQHLSVEMAEMIRESIERADSPHEISAWCHLLNLQMNPHVREIIEKGIQRTSG